MRKYKSKNVKASLKNAGKGVSLALKSETNIRIHILVGILVFSIGVLMNLDYTKLCILLLVIALVITTEMLNTAIEFTIDSVFHNRFSPLAGMAKDVSAAAVMFSAIISVIIGLFIFVPEILSLIS